jgi:hypothetical protein
MPRHCRNNSVSKIQASDEIGLQLRQVVIKRLRHEGSGFHDTGTCHSPSWWPHLSNALLNCCPAGISHPDITRHCCDTHPASGQRCNPVSGVL